MTRARWKVATERARVFRGFMSCIYLSCMSCSRYNRCNVEGTQSIAKVHASTGPSSSVLLPTLIIRSVPTRTVFSEAPQGRPRFGITYDGISWHPIETFDVWELNLITQGEPIPFTDPIPTPIDKQFNLLRRAPRYVHLLADQQAQLCRAERM